MVMEKPIQVLTNLQTLDIQEHVKDILKFMAKINQCQWVDLQHHIGMFHHKEAMDQDQWGKPLQLTTKSSKEIKMESENL